MPVGVRLSLSLPLCVLQFEMWKRRVRLRVGRGAWLSSQACTVVDVQCSRFVREINPPRRKLKRSWQWHWERQCVSVSLSVPLPACLPSPQSLSLFLFGSCVSIVDAHANFVSVVSVVVDVDVGVVVCCNDRTCLALPRARLELPNRTHTHPHTSTHHSAPAHGFLFRIASTKQKTKMPRTASSAAYRSASTRRAKLGALDKRERVCV